jgi:glucosamine--fructose-6-phosphate aminotransferase (isomerizing)
VIGDTLHALIHPTTGTIHLPDLPFALGDIPKATIVACGTSYNAGLVAKYWFERIARIPVEVDIASEFRYRAPDMPKGGAAIVISQSGETADTLAALRYCRECGQKIIAVVNQPESSIAREADVVLPTLAGPRDRRRLDQGLHHPARRAGGADRGAGAGARHDRRRDRGGARPSARRDPVARRRCAEP